MESKLILLAVFWSVWCVLHSLLITPAVTGRIENHWGRYFVYYRLAYNLFVCLTVLPLWLYTKSLSNITGALWPWPYFPFQVLIALLGLAALVAGGRAYDLPFFLGLRQIKDSPGHQSPVGPGPLKKLGHSGNGPASLVHRRVVADLGPKNGPPHSNYVLDPLGLFSGRSPARRTKVDTRLWAGLP